MLFFQSSKVAFCLIMTETNAHALHAVLLLVVKKGPRLFCSHMTNSEKNNIDAGELHPLVVQCYSEKMRAQQKCVCGCEIIEWCSCVFASRCAPPHSSTQGDMCMRTWDKFYKRRINVRIHGDGDTCLGVMWCLFFLFVENRGINHLPVVEICAVCEMSCGPCMISLVTAPRSLLLQLVFCLRGVLPL